MSSGASYMNFGQKVSLTISVLGLIVAFTGLALSDGVSGLTKRADVVADWESTNLDGLADSPGYIDVLSFRNRGNAASKNVSLIINFDSEVPDYDLSSDEDIGEADIDGRRLKVRMERLSVGSNLKVSMFSRSPIVYDASYIDDSGNHKISINDNDTSRRSLVDFILLLVLIVSLLVIVWIFRRASESALMDTLESHHNEIQETLREVLDEIGNVEVAVKDSYGSSVTEPNGNDKGLSQRIAELMSKV